MEILYPIIGQITYSLTRIDFLISSIASDFGLAETPYIYFAKSKFEKKIDNLKDGLKKQLKDEAVLTELEEWTNRLHELREKRNNIIHSIILSNPAIVEEYTFFNFRNDKSGNLIKDCNKFSLTDLKLLNQEFIDTHNAGYILWGKLRELIVN